MEESRYKHKIQTMHSTAQQIALDRISSPSPHGSPYHVHPYPSPVRLQHAFQPPPNNSPNMFYPKGLKPPQFDNRAYASPQPSPILGRALCLTSKDSPIPGRVSHLNERFNDSLSLHSDTDSMVAKISAMFPTVTETHIRILLKKYFNREAVVISALQVEKHPLVMPGPLTMSPSAARLSKGAAGIYSAIAMAKGLSAASTQEYYLPFTTTPHSSPSLFRPPSGTSSYFGTTMKTSDGQITRQHSPKMKLKYLKSIFPKADELIILDILTNNDNNVQKVSEELIKRGFIKKETNLIKKDMPPPPPPMPIKKTEAIIRTQEEKASILANLKKLYPLLVEEVILIALDSVDYDGPLTEQILNSVVVEDNRPRPRLFEPKQTKRVTLVEPTKGSAFDETPRPLSPPPPARRPKPWAQPLKPILKNSNMAPEPKYRSYYFAPRRGANPHLRQGPQDTLLLADYLPWTGPDPELLAGAIAKPEGPAQRAGSASSNARGPSGNAKGPQGLAKGSTYHKNNKFGENAKP